MESFAIMVTLAHREKFEVFARSTKSEEAIDPCEVCSLAQALKEMLPGSSVSCGDGSISIGGDWFDAQDYEAYSIFLDRDMKTFYEGGHPSLPVSLVFVPSVPEQEE